MHYGSVTNITDTSNDDPTFDTSFSSTGSWGPVDDEASPSTYSMKFKGLKNTGTISSSPLLRSRIRAGFGLRQSLINATKHKTRECVKFSLMVAGASGTGKSTFINMLFENEAHTVRRVTSGNVDIDIYRLEVEEHGIKGNFTVLDTSRFGYQGASGAQDPIINYLDSQLKHYFDQEGQPRRTHLRDTRIHACVYFLPPLSSPSPSDIQLMQELCQRTNLIPVIGQSDSCVPTELAQIKDTIRRTLEEHEIMLPKIIMSVAPYAMICSTEYVTPGHRGRKYPWGNVDVEEASEWGELRKVLFSEHMLELKDSVHDYFYAHYRANVMANRYHAAIGSLRPSSSSDFLLPGSELTCLEVARLINSSANDGRNGIYFSKESGRLRSAYMQLAAEQSSALQERVNILVENKQLLDVDLDRARSYNSSLRSEIAKLQYRCVPHSAP